MTADDVRRVLAEDASVKSQPSCGCVFCDVGVPITKLVDGQCVHRGKHMLNIPCRLIEIVRADAAAKEWESIAANYEVQSELWKATQDPSMARAYAAELRESWKLDYPE